MDIIVAVEHESIYNFYFTRKVSVMANQEEQFMEVLEYYSSIREEGEQELLIKLLHETMGIYGCIPIHLQGLIAEKMNVKPSTITILIKMIPTLTSESYKHKITVCSGPRCGAKGGADIIMAVQKVLNVKPNQVTKDGNFLFTTQNCLKKCGMAPNLYVNDDLYSRLQPEDIKGILDKYSN